MQLTNHMQIEFDKNIGDVMKHWTPEQLEFARQAFAIGWVALNNHLIEVLRLDRPDARRVG
jgi:hypothetical protein